MLPPEPSDASVFTQPAPDSPRARRYMALFDRSVAEVRERFDAERGLIRHTVPEGSPGVAPEIASLDRFLRKSYISPLNQWAYRVGRTSSSHTGTLAYAYAQPLSRYYHDPGLLRAVCQGFEAFIRAQDASGEFVFTPIRYASVYGTHEMSWRLECFITAYFCIRDALTEDQRTRYWAFLNRAMRFLRATPCDHPCNRGMVWAAVMSMCWRATGDESYLRDAREMWRLINPHIFHESGQVNEGPGPCTVYSPISYEYLMRYRIMTEDPSLDPIIRRSTDWMAEMYTDCLTVFQGASTRHDSPNTAHKAAPMLLACELFVEDSPQYADMADSILLRLEERCPEAPAQHGSIAWITAAAHHKPDATARASGARRPAWVHHYAIDATEYYTVGQEGYQTMLALRGLPAKKGMQTWAARGEPAFIFPEEGHVSTVRAWGYDLAGRDATRWESQRADTSDIASVTAQHGALLVTYLVGPQSLIVVHTLEREQERETVWCGSKRHIKGYVLDGTKVKAEGARGALYWWGPAPVLSEDRLEIRFRDRAATQVYAFSRGELRRGGEAQLEGEALMVEWTDAAGHYVAVVNHATKSVPVALRLPGDRTEKATLEPMQAHVWRVGPSL